MPDSPPRQRRVSSHSVHRRRRLIALVVAIAVLAVGVDAVRGDSTSGWGGSLNTGNGIRAAIEVPWIQRPKDAFGREVDVNGLPVAASQQEVLAKLIKTGKPVFCAGGTKPYISLTFDDGPSKEGERVVNLLRADRQRASFFLIGNSVTEFPQEVPKRLEAGDVGDHSMSHPDLTTLTDAQVIAEESGAKTLIESHTGKKCVSLAYPYCTVPNKSITSQYYSFARSCNGSLVPSTPSDFLSIGSLGPDAGMDAPSDSAASSGSWLVWLIHGIDNDAACCPVASSVLQSNLNYVTTDTNKWWIETFGNVCRYIQERNAAVLTVVSNGTTRPLLVASTVPTRAWT